MLGREGMLDTRCWILDARSWMLDAGPALKLVNYKQPFDFGGCFVFPQWRLFDEHQISFQQSL